MEYISELKSGCLYSFQAVYSLYHAKLYAYILKKTGSEYMAEEVVQLTFIRLWENKEKLSDDFGLSQQLFKMAGSILIDQIRKEAVRKKNLNLVEHQEVDRGIDNYRDLAEMFDLAIEVLSPMRKKIFKLSRKDGYSYKEIAEMLSISPKTVENQISKAIKQLKAVFGSTVTIAILFPFIFRK